MGIKHEEYKKIIFTTRDNARKHNLALQKATSQKFNTLLNRIQSEKGVQY